MKNKFQKTFKISTVKILFYFLIFIQHPSALSSGGWISGGGDPLRIYFEEGQLLAQKLLPLVNTTIVGNEFDQEIKDWLKNHKYELAKDIANTKLNWTVELQPTCAKTSYSAQAEILLALPNCRGIVTKEEAAKVLIHEATHHLGNLDESFADKIAVLSFVAFELSKLKGVPDCPERDPEITTNLAGIWQFDLPLTRKLGGAFEGGPRGQLEFSNDPSVVKEFPAFGRCAYTSGQATITNRRGQFTGNYVVAEFHGRPVLVIHKMESAGGVPLGPNLRQFSIDLTIGAENDLLFLGNKQTGESKSAFKKIKISPNN
jgi:hypothetical protein